MIDGARPEIELVCRCLSPSLDAGDRERIDTLLAADLDWAFLLEFARHHGVVPALHERLVGEYGSHLDEEVRATLEERRQSRTATNLRMANSLHELLDRFEDANVRALPFKGPVLAEVAYGSLSRRTFNDLDVLVHEEDISRALDVMESMGYKSDLDAPRLDDAAILGGPLTPQLATEYSMRHPEGDIVEIRWRVGSNPFAFTCDFETLWERRETVLVAGRAMPALSSEDRLLMLSYHCVKHGCALLKWVADVARGVHATPEQDWEALYRRAGEYGVTRRLTVGLGVAMLVLDIDVPAITGRLRNDAVAADLVEEVYNRLATRPLREFEAVDTQSFHVWASDSRYSRALSRLFSTPVHPTLADYRVLPLPGPFHPVYYVLRPLRLLIGRTVSNCSHAAHSDGDTQTRLSALFRR